MNNESAGTILARVNEDNRYRFDQACRVKAVQLAARLGINTFLSINFMPNAIYRPETCIRTTLEAAQTYNFPGDRIIFEVTEGERVNDRAHLLDILREYRHLGFKTAMDDFGSMDSGLRLLAAFQPDFVKVELDLVRGVDQNPVRSAIIQGRYEICLDIGCQVIAEGVETREELEALREIGITLYQGYYFAKPAFQSLAEISDDVWQDNSVDTLET